MLSLSRGKVKTTPSTTPSNTPSTTPSTTRHTVTATFVVAVVLGVIVLLSTSSEFGATSPILLSNENTKHSIQNMEDLSPILKGQWNRLLLLEAGIEPILPAPVIDDKNTAMDPETIKRHIVQKNLAAFYGVYNNIGEWKYTLFSRLDNIRLHCGKLCQLNTLSEIEKYTSAPKLDNDQGVLPLVTVPDVDCDTILSLEDIDAGDMTFPATIPDELKSFYTLNGTVILRIDSLIRRDAYLEGSAEKKLWPTGNVWNEDDINEAVKNVTNKTLVGPYGLQETIDLTENLSQIEMKGKSVLVIGSSHPWVEAICLHHGAAKVTTLEYGEIISNHPQIETETPRSIREKYVNGELDFFDGIVTHSSVEHSGLGRYGDALNPWGDLLAVARAWCIAKPKAFMWVGVPTGQDRVFYNWHRVYGFNRWPILATNWRQVGKDINFGDVAGRMAYGVWKSMQNIGFIFEKVNPKDFETTDDE